MKVGHLKIFNYALFFCPLTSYLTNFWLAFSSCSSRSSHEMTRCFWECLNLQMKGEAEIFMHGKTTSLIMLSKFLHCYCSTTTSTHQIHFFIVVDSWLRRISVEEPESRKPILMGIFQMEWDMVKDRNATFKKACKFCSLLALP